MAGQLDPTDITEAERAQIEAIRGSAWARYGYRDVLPPRGLTIGGRPALTGTDPRDVGRYVVFTVRDPLGGEHDEPHGLRLARQFGPAREVGATGLFQVYTADMDGTAVTVVATGSGSPELELALVEIMDHSDAEVLVYFGTAAGLHPFVSPGQVVISSGVVREEGMTKAYVDTSFPAAPSYDVVAALVSGAESAEVPYRVGLTRSTDSDPLGNGRPSVGGYFQRSHADVLDYWIRAGVLCNDREASAVVTLGTLFGRRTGVVVGVTDNFPSGKTLMVGAGMENAAETLVAGLRELSRMDATKRAHGRQYWSPALAADS